MLYILCISGGYKNLTTCVYTEMYMDKNMAPNWSSISNKIVL